MERTAGSARRRMAAWVTLLAITVGGVVAAAAAVSGAGMCSTPLVDPERPSPPDAVCYQLVRTLAERVGLVAAVATAIMALTVIGLSRLVITDLKRGDFIGPAPGP